VALMTTKLWRATWSRRCPGQKGTETGGKRLSKSGKGGKGFNSGKERGPLPRREGVWVDRTRKQASIFPKLFVQLGGWPNQEGRGEVGEGKELKKRSTGPVTVGGGAVRFFGIIRRTVPLDKGMVTWVVTRKGDVRHTGNSGGYLGNEKNHQREDADSWEKYHSSDERIMAPDPKESRPEGGEWKAGGRHERRDEQPRGLRQNSAKGGESG